MAATPGVAPSRARDVAMIARGRAYARLLIVYFASVEALAVLWTGRFYTGPEIIVKAVVIPALQIFALEVAGVIARRVWGSLLRDGLVRFFGRWLILAATLAAITVAIDWVMVDRADLTALTFLALLVTPSIQAAVSGETTQRIALNPLWNAVRRNSLVTPFLGLDALLLSAGWGLAGHPLIGMSEAGLLQRRWMSAKLLAAGIVFIRCARAPRTVTSPRGRRALLGLGAALLGGALIVASLPMVTKAVAVLSTCARQPPPVLWLGIDAGALLLGIVATIALRGSLPTGSSASHLTGWAAIALFVTTLTLMMNAFSSAQPVPPWAGLTVTSGSLAATFFLVASLVLASARAESS